MVERRIDAPSGDDRPNPPYRTGAAASSASGRYVGGITAAIARMARPGDRIRVDPRAYRATTAPLPRLARSPFSFWVGRLERPWQSRLGRPATVVSRTSACALSGRPVAYRTDSPPPMLPPMPPPRFSGRVAGVSASVGVARRAAP